MALVSQEGSDNDVKGLLLSRHEVMLTIDMISIAQLSHEISFSKRHRLPEERVAHLRGIRDTDMLHFKTLRKELRNLSRATSKEEMLLIASPELGKENARRLVADPKAFTDILRDWE